MKNLNSLVSDWYISKYPEDELGKEIDSDTCFLSVLMDLPDVYDVIGVYDSIVRERVFQKLADMVGCDYSIIYNQWTSSQ